MRLYPLRLLTLYLVVKIHRRVHGVVRYGCRRLQTASVGKRHWSNVGLDRGPVIQIAKGHDKGLIRVIGPAQPHRCLPADMIEDDVEKSRTSTFSFLICPANRERVVVFVLPQLRECRLRAVKAREEMSHPPVAAPRVRQGIKLLRRWPMVEQAVVRVHYPPIGVSNLLAQADGRELQPVGLVCVAHHDERASRHAPLRDDFFIRLRWRCTFEGHAQREMRGEASGTETL